MDKLTKYLVETITEKQIAVFGGNFSPPTKGHFLVVQEALKRLPNIEEFIIFVGNGTRDGVNQEHSFQIWEIYKKYLSEKVKIEKVISPITSIYDYSKDNPGTKIIWVFGAREGEENDTNDIKKRTKALSSNKYLNLSTLIISTKGGISGSKMRQVLNSKEEFINFIPSELSEKDKEKVYQIVNNKEIKENIEEGKQVGILYHYTRLSFLKRIIENNYLKSNRIGYNYVISFTRDKNFHNEQRNITGTECRIILDGNKLSDKYKIFPKSEKGFSRSKTEYFDEFSESEERIESEKPFWVNNLDSYVISYDVFLDRIKLLNRDVKIVEELLNNNKVKFYSRDKELSKEEIKEWVKDKFELEEINKEVINELNDKELKYWALHYDLFQKLNNLNFVEKYKEIKPELKGEDLEALNYFYKILNDQDSISKLLENKENNYKKYILYLNKVLEYCCKELQIPRPKVVISNEKYLEDHTSFGGYQPDNNQITLVIKNRNLSDSCRTLSHEIFHSKQNKEGILNSNSGETGSDEENMANSYAGQVLRVFNKKYPEILTMTI